MSTINSSGHIKMVSLPSNTFPGQAKTSYKINQYFVHILAPVIDSAPSATSGRRKESKWPDWVLKLGPPSGL